MSRPKRMTLQQNRVRPLLALAVFADGSKKPLLGWTVEYGETHYEALQRTAIEIGAERAEIIATLH